MSRKIPKENRRIIIPAASSVYQLLGVACDRPQYEIEYSEELIRQYGHGEIKIPKGFRISTAAEELAIQHALEKNDNDPRDAVAYNDIFGRNEERFDNNNGWHALLLTETRLRVPIGWENGRYETDEKGRKYWPRIVLIGDEEVGEVSIPEGNGRVIMELDEVFGLPKITEEDSPKYRLDSHFWFKTEPGMFFKTKKYEDDIIALKRGPQFKERIDMYADFMYAHGKSYEDDGYRLVKGSMPTIAKETSRTSPLLLKEAILKQLKKDFKNIPFPEFQKKYNLK